MGKRQSLAIRCLRGGRASRAKKPRQSAAKETGNNEEGSEPDNLLEQAALAMSDPFSPRVAGGLSAWGTSRDRTARKPIDEDDQDAPQEGA
jgi:hypothetical protein